MARVSVRSPTLLLSDEPLRNLDAKIQETMKSWFKRLQRELGETVIYATHDPFEGMAIGDRMAILLNEVVRQLGSPSEIYFRPKSLDVAEYVSIPAMSVLEGVAEIAGDVLTITVDAVHISKKVVEKLPFTGRKKVLVGIRPQDVLISKEPEANKIEGKVSLVQVFGSEILLTIDVDRTSIRAIAERKLAIREGETIYISFDEARVFVFGPETKNVIRV